MAVIHCPLCGRKNWIPDGAELKCFFCGNPLPPEPDLSQNVQYAPLQEPKQSVPPGAEQSPFAAQGAAGSSGQTNQNTEELPPELAYLAAYIAEELEAPPPKGTENLPGITLSFRQWFFLDTVYICTLMAFSQYLMSGPVVSDAGAGLILIVLIGMTSIIPLISRFSPFKAKKPGSDSETISFRGFISAISYVGLIAGAMVGSLRLGMLDGIVTEILAGIALSMLAHLIKLLRSK